MGHMKFEHNLTKMILEKNNINLVQGSTVETTQKKLC
jgi:hypothetical protein